jgi:hypothetical protein
MQLVTQFIIIIHELISILIDMFAYKIMPLEGCPLGVDGGGLGDAPEVVEGAPGRLLPCHGLVPASAIAHAHLHQNPVFLIEFANIV